MARTPWISTRSPRPPASARDGHQRVNGAVTGEPASVGEAVEAAPGPAWPHRHLLDTDVLTWPQIEVVLGVIAEYRLDGIIATNTTLARPGAFASVGEAGGLSGAPLRRRATEIINFISRATGGRLPIIGVGGITNVESAAEKLDAGATLVQVYTGMIYRGPFFAAELARGLMERQRVR